jgi:hypothetical protein
MRGLYKSALQACQSIQRYNQVGLTDQDRQAQLIHLDLVLSQQVNIGRSVFQEQEVIVLESYSYQDASKET